MNIIADDNIPFVKEVFGVLGQVRTVRGREMTQQAVADADLLLVRSTVKVDANLLACCRARFVATATIGTDHVDLACLAKRGIAFASAAGSNANSVSEYFTAALLVLAERGGYELAGKTIGVVGIGNVGSRVVCKAQALGMEVVQNDPPLARRTGDKRYRPIEELLEADFITFHVPLTRSGTDATYHMVDRRFLNALKRGAVLINTSRGPVVDQSALSDAIRERRLSAVVLDVWENEPDINTELLQMVDIATPHIAGHSFDGKVAGTAMIYEAACRSLGVRPKVDVFGLMPPPPVPSLVVDGGATAEAVVRSTVLKVYDILADDARLREILRKPREERPKFFDALRRNYPVRREFHNTVLSFRSCPQTAVEALTGLGFRSG